MINENVVALKYTKEYKIWKVILFFILLFACGMGAYTYFHAKKEKSVYWDMLYTTVSQIGMVEQVAKTSNPPDGDYTNVLKDLELTADHVDDSNYLTYRLTKESIKNKDSWVMNINIPSQSACKKFLEVVTEAKKIPSNSRTLFVYWKQGENVLNENCGEDKKEKYLIQLGVPVGLWKVD